jgi:hypothetical protein
MTAHLEQQQTPCRFPVPMVVATLFSRFIAAWTAAMPLSKDPCLVAISTYACPALIADMLYSYLADAMEFLNSSGKFGASASKAGRMNGRFG